jgi:ER degradation enhancer, mannosidase alpha-like 2
VTRWLCLLLLVACAAPERERVRGELRHAWNGYVRYAWGHDELRPLSHAPRDWYGESLLITPVDSLDTLILLGLDDEAARTREYVATHLSLDKDIWVKNFEITIRVLGGLLSAYQLTSDPRLLALADDLGRRLSPVFASPTGMPYMYVNLKTGAVRGAESNPAEIGTLILEFGALARLTGKPAYYDEAKRAVMELYARRSRLGLVGSTINVETGAWTQRDSHVGGGIDSYYEYLLKASLLFDDADFRRMWLESVAALNAHVADEQPSGLWYGVVDMDSGQRTATEFGALEAFLPAVLALGGDVARARRLEDSALAMWRQFGVEPDGFDYVNRKATAPGYPLRPEIIESAYYLGYRDLGPKFLDDLVACCRTDAGYAVLKSVVTKDKDDLMPSYFIAETLKYLFLLAAPETVDFAQVVFTTEAHPLRRTW